MMKLCYRCGEREDAEEFEGADCPSCSECAMFTHQQMADILNNLYVSGQIEEADLEYDDE